MKVRITKILPILVSVLFCTQLGLSQTPQGFNYQAIIRDGSGNPIVSKTIGMKITIENALEVDYFSETHTPTTNAQGVISITIGNGTKMSSNTFASIPWKNGDAFIKVEVDPSGGTAYVPIGNPTKLMSVPYALYADNTKEVISQPDALDEEPIFVVRNKAGKIVFAVYQAGVRVYVEDTSVKGTKGGFAVGGLSGQSKGDVEYFRITPDSARIFVNEVPTTKGTKGGFAVGGLSGQSKAITSRNLMFVAADSTRIYIDSSSTVKGTKGGFAVGGLSGQSKGGNFDLLKITADSTRIYVGNSTAKGTKGGFAVGGLSGQSKAGISPNLMYIGTDSARIYIDDSTTPKGTKGGFAVGGLSGQSKGTSNEFIRISRDSARIYIDETSSKGTKGGFAVGGLSGQSKAVNNKYMQLTPQNYFIGHNSGTKTTGLYNSFLGYETGVANTSGKRNVFLGYHAGYSNDTASFNVFIGNESGKANAGGSNNVFLGYRSGFSNSAGKNNTFLGHVAGYLNNIGANNVFLGDSSGYNNNGNQNIFLGNGSGKANTNGAYNAFIGFRAGHKNKIGLNNAFIGYQAGYSNETGNNNAFIGYQAGWLTWKGSRNVFIGHKAGYLNYGISQGPTFAGNNNIYIGDSTGYKNTTGFNNVYIGTNAGSGSPSYTSNSSKYNVYIGYQSGFKEHNGDKNVFIGFQAGFENSSGSYLTFIGLYAGSAHVSGNDNIFIGNSAGGQHQIGTTNVMIGPYAGLTNTTGSGNVFIGNTAGKYDLGDNKLYIDNQDRTNDANAKKQSLVYGEFSNVPTSQQLTINGKTTTNGPLNYGTAAGASNAYTVSIPGISAYAIGMVITFQANAANTGACTVNVNSLGTISLKMKHDQDPTANYIENGSMVIAVFDGVYFQMIQPAAN